jgi:predicted dienelactone hydrolase
MITRVFRIVTILTMVVLVAAPISLSLAQDNQPQGIRPDAPPYGVRGPHPVGAMDLTIEPDSDRPIVTAVWYPALNPNSVAEETTYYALPGGPDMPVSGHAIMNAMPDTANGPYPLIIMSPGRPGARVAFPYYGEQLASHGFIAVTLAPFGNVMTAELKSMAYALYYVPQDITRTIDAFEEFTKTDGTLKGMVDTEHIGVTGMSFGGYTSLIAGGAQVNLSVLKSYCAKSASDTRCDEILGGTKELAGYAGLPAVPDGSWPSWGDPRVDAIVPIVPGPGVIGEGAKSVTVPTLLILGSADTTAIPAYNGYPIWDNLGASSKTLVEFINANHTFSIFKCSDGPWLGAVAYPWCSDPVWDMDRAHDLLDHFATAFFLSTLKGDSAATAALAPSAVNFTSIRYETTGF